MLHHSGLLNASHIGNVVVFVDNCYGELVEDLQPTAVGPIWWSGPVPGTSDGGEALIGADLVATVFSELGFPVHPEPGSHRSDVIQEVRLGAPEPLHAVYRAFQSCSPLGAYLCPLLAPMPGYGSELRMAGGTFIDGTTTNPSPMPPCGSPSSFDVQGGTHHSHVGLALESLGGSGGVAAPQQT